MIIGAHTVIFSRKPDVDRAFLRDVLKLSHVDSGDGWLIFGLPPAEVAVHPSAKNDVHEFFLLCADVDAFIAEMKKRRIACEPVQKLDWGALTRLTLPGGGRLGVYQPRHVRPKSMRSSAVAGRPAPRVTRRPAKAASGPPARKKSKPRAR